MQWQWPGLKEAMWHIEDLANREGPLLRSSKAKPRKNHFNFLPHDTIGTLHTKRNNKKIDPFEKAKAALAF